MARASVNQVVLFQETPSAPWRAFTSVRCTMTPKIETDKIVSAGQRFATSTYLKKEWSEASIDGVLDYTEARALLSWLMTETTSGNVRSYTTGQARTRNLTVGDATTAATIREAFATSAEFTFGRSSGDASVKMSLIGGQWNDGDTLPSHTALPPHPISATHVSVYVSDTLDGLRAYSNDESSVLKATVKLDKVRDPLWLLNGAPSHSGAVETVIDGSVELVVEANGYGLDVLNRLRSGATHYIRIIAREPLPAGMIGANGGSWLQFDLAVQASDVSRGDQESVYASTVMLNIVTDADGFSHDISLQDMPWTPVAPAPAAAPVSDAGSTPAGS